jgi:hypothetical protein
VALVFKQIEGYGADAILDHVRKIPPGLENIYAQMMHHVNDLDDAGHCKKVLLSMVNTYRPLHLSDLATLARLPELAVYHQIVRQCGLLTIREDDDMVYFVHQSAKDYPTKDPKPDILSKIFPFGHAEGHRMIVSQSVEAMSKTLQMDNYTLQHPGKRRGVSGPWGRLFRRAFPDKSWIRHPVYFGVKHDATVGQMHIGAVTDSVNSGPVMRQ